MTAGWRLAGRTKGLASSAIRDVLRLAERPDVLSLAGGLPADDVLPVERIAAAVDAVLTSEGHRALQYAPTEGIAPLREWVAARASEHFGRPVPVEAVMVTTGSQQALDLLARVLSDPGDPVAVEHPGYLGAHQALRAAGADLVGIPVDEGGIDVEALEARAAQVPLRLCVTVPDFQNPTGATLARQRRRALTAFADRTRIPVVDDGPYRDLRFTGPALPPLASCSDQVISLGSFSKTLAPGLRVGWVVAPPDLVEWLVKAKQAADLQTPTLSQAVVAELVADEGWLEAHLQSARAVYRERCHALIGALARVFDGDVTWTEPEGGMFVWCRLAGGGATASELLAAALEEGVAFVPGDAFSVGAPDPAAFRLSFATLTPSELGEAVARLARALAHLRDTGAAA